MYAYMPAHASFAWCKIILSCLRLLVLVENNDSNFDGVVEVRVLIRSVNLTNNRNCPRRHNMCACVCACVHQWTWMNDEGDKETSGAAKITVQPVCDVLD